MNRLKALYYPADEDREILRLSERDPCQASVIEANGRTANLLVTDHFGNHFVRLHVPFSRRDTSCDICVIA